MSETPADVLNLRDAINELATAKTALSTKRETFETSIEAEAGQVKTMAAKVENLKAAIGPLAIAEFKETGSKKMWGGVGVQEKTELTYDAAKALAFAKSKDMFLILDVSTFEKAAPTLGLDFVKSEKTPKATFPKEITL